MERDAFDKKFDEMKLRIQNLLYTYGLFNNTVKQERFLYKKEYANGL